MFLSKYKVFVPKGDNPRKKSIAVANALAIELHNYGIWIDPEIANRLYCQTPGQAKKLSKRILAAFTIGDVNPPLFKQWEERTVFAFEEQVIQILGYIFQLSGNDIEDPSYLEKLRSNVDFKKQKALTLATYKEAEDHFLNLVNSSVGQNRQQKKTLSEFAEVFSLTGFIRSDEARIAVLRAKGIEFATEMNCRPADMLRYFVSDFTQVNLPHDVKYRNMKWSERVEVMRFWNYFTNEDLMEAMGNNRGAWNRFFNHGKFLRQDDFRRRFSEVIACAWVSIGGKKSAANVKIKPSLKEFVKSGLVELTEEDAYVYRTFASRVQSAIDSRDFKKIKKTIGTNHGYLLRNLATVANGVKKKDYEKFRDFVGSAIPSANPSVLFSLLQINVDSQYRVIDAKGSTTVQPASYPEVIRDIQSDIKDTLKRRYGVKGKIKVSNVLKNKPVPFLSRNTELDRGERIPFKDEQFLYFFMHWIQPDYIKTDLDHSFLIFDKKARNCSMVNYARQVNSFITCSGDFTSAPAPNGATEYGRIDLNKIPHNVDYVVPICNVYSGVPFSENKEAYAGFQFSDKARFGIQRDHVRYDLSQPAQANMPFIIDLQAREVVIIDFNERGRKSADASGYAQQSLMLAEATKTMNKLTIGQFADMLSTGDDVVMHIKTNPSKQGEIAPSELSSLVS